VKIAIYLIIIMIGIQFIPIERDNPTFDKTDEIVTSPEVKKLLKASCYDCHSNEVKYSIYSYIAPLSWGVRSHIKQGRLAVNFSTWEKMDPKLRDKRIDRMANEIRREKMALSSYLMFHPEAHLSKEERQLLVDWAENDLIKYKLPQEK
jgi:uncharacterized membrane protein